MLEPVLKYKAQIIDTCNGFKESEMANGLDFEAIENLLNGMVLVKLAVEALSRQDATLALADKTISFLYKLKRQGGQISNLLLGNLKLRLSARVNESCMNLLRCLLNPNKSPTNSDVRLAKELPNRLFTVDSTSDQEIEPVKEAPSTLEEELNEIINGVYDEPPVCHEYI